MAISNGNAVAAHSEFRTDVADSMSGLQAALGSVLQALTRVHGSIRIPSDLQRLTDLDAKLAWRVFKIVHAADPLAASVFVPGSASLGRFLKAAAEHGVSERRIQAVSTAHRKLQ